MAFEGHAAHSSGLLAWFYGEPLGLGSLRPMFNDSVCREWRMGILTPRGVICQSPNCIIAPIVPDWVVKGVPHPPVITLLYYMTWRVIASKVPLCVA